MQNTKASCKYDKKYKSKMFEILKKKTNTLLFKYQFIVLNSNNRVINTN